MSGVPDVFVDRHHELSVLTESLRAASEFQCRLVLVEGERRIGKTSLCDAFLDVVRRQPNTRFAYGQCIEHLGISDSDLSKQMAALEVAGYVSISKTGRGRGATTTYRITGPGRAAYERHRAALRALLDS